MIYHFIPEEDITQELIHAQTKSINNIEIVYYNFDDGRYGVLMFDEPQGYESYTEQEAYNHIKDNAIIEQPFGEG